MHQNNGNFLNSCLFSAITSGLTFTAFQFIFLSFNYFGVLKIKLFTLISDPKEENEESEIEEKHHVKP